jgi:hypothetical protein
MSRKKDFAPNATSHYLTRRIITNIARSAVHSVELSDGLILWEVRAASTSLPQSRGNFIGTALRLLWPHLG